MYSTAKSKTFALKGWSPMKKPDGSKARAAVRRRSQAASSISSDRAAKADLELTACQVVLRFFELDKAVAYERSYQEALRQVLDLLHECEWEKETRPGGWIALDPKGCLKSTITSLDALIERHIKPLASEVDNASDFLRSWADKTPEEKDQFAEEVTLAAAAAQAQPLAQHGEIGNGRADENRVAVRHSKPASKVSSESWDRILPRLARDRPDILERVKAGEFKSARAAAIEAGIVKDVPTVRLTEPEKAAAGIVARMGAGWAHRLAEALIAETTQ